MALSFGAGQLSSRTVRNSIGPRSFVPTVAPGGGGFNMGGALNGFLVGSILSGLPGMLWSLTGLWGMFIEAFQAIYYFDWNVPDDQLDRQAASIWQSYGGILGGVAGNAVGWLACGVVPATSIFAFNESMGAYVLREVGEEALSELTANMAMTLQLATRNLARQGFLWSYKNVRKWLKDPSNPTLDLIFGGRADQIREDWGAADSPSYTFAGAVEEKIEKIPSEFWRNFTEEFIEEAMDACFEAGYALSSSIESYWAEQRMSQLREQEAARAVEITPNRENERETILLAGPDKSVRAAIPATLATHQLIEARDVGAIMGEPINDYIRARPLGLRLQYVMYSVPSPPYAARRGQTLVKATVNIPDIKRTALDWDRLLRACGGQNGYLWGRFRATAQLTNGRQMVVYAGAESEAEDRLKAFLDLSDATIKSLSISEEKKEGERLTNPRLYKDTARVYPGYVTVINRERVLAQDRGYASLNGNWADKKAKFDLWRIAEPPDFNELLRELLRHSDLE